MQIHEMTQKEIEAEIFKGASQNEPRGFSDAFTPEEILQILRHPDYEFFDWEFKCWLWAALDRLLTLERSTLRGSSHPL
jgi:hypothetical protein